VSKKNKPEDRGVGRPRAGFKPLSGGPPERVRDYPTLTVRLPAETRKMLVALQGVLKQPLWRVIHEIATVYVHVYLKKQRERDYREVLRVEPTARKSRSDTD
jgi:hypothetical protein